MARNTVIGRRGIAPTKGNGSPRAASHQLSAVSSWFSALRASGIEKKTRISGSGSGYIPDQPYTTKRNYAKLIWVGTGFTFIEMVMVCVMVAILVAIAVPIYQSSVLATKEAVLKSNLALIRERLDQFKADRGDYPQTLDELVERGYFRELPEDPMIEENQWEEIFEEFDPDEPEEELGIYDVRSLSQAVGTDGIPYSEW